MVAELVLSATVAVVDCETARVRSREAALIFQRDAERCEARELGLRKQLEVVSRLVVVPAPEPAVETPWIWIGAGGVVVFVVGMLVGSRF